MRLCRLYLIRNVMISFYIVLYSLLTKTLISNLQVAGKLPVFGLPISNYHPFILLFTSFCRLMLQRYQGWYKIVYGLVSFVSTCDEIAQK